MLVLPEACLLLFFFHVCVLRSFILSSLFTLLHSMPAACDGMHVVVTALRDLFVLLVDGVAESFIYFYYAFPLYFRFCLSFLSLHVMIVGNICNVKVLYSKSCFLLLVSLAFEPDG